MRRRRSLLSPASPARGLTRSPPARASTRRCSTTTSGDKRGLYTAVLMRNFDRVQVAVDEALAAPGSARRRLEAVITALTRVVQEHPDHPRIVLREIASGAVNLPPEALARMLEVVGVVRQSPRGGHCRRRVPPSRPGAHPPHASSARSSFSTPPRRSASGRPQLGPGFDLPEPTADVAAFLNAMLLDGIAVRPGKGVRP